MKGLIASTTGNTADRFIYLPPDTDPFPIAWDVVVVGGGAAGLMAALELPKALKVLLLCRDGEPRSASRWAQGDLPLRCVQTTAQACIGPTPYGPVQA